MASAALSSGGTTAQSEFPSGMPINDGNEAVSAPSSAIVRMPMDVNPKCWVAIERSASPINSTGSRGQKRSNTQKMSNVTTPMQSG